jgi:hypothetical protein
MCRVAPVAFFAFVAIAIQPAIAVTVQNFSTNSEDSTVGQIREVRTNHFVVQQAGVNWFMFRLSNVRDQTVRIDLKNVKNGHWWSVNPLYVYADSPDDPSLFKTTPVATNAPVRKLPNKVVLPDTSRQAWQFITNVWTETHVLTNILAVTNGTEVINVEKVSTNGIYCFRHTFTADTAIVAMRYPYTVGYGDRYFQSLRERKERDKMDFLEIHDIGKSQGGRMLRIAVIGPPEKYRENPCLLLYGREDGTEPDGSWVAEGAIEFLVSNNPEAKRIRSSMTTIVITMLDPDASAAGVYKGICSEFGYGSPVPEVMAYGAWFHKWISAGNRLDLTVDLHNVEGGQVRWHAFPLLGDPDAARHQAQEHYVSKVLKPLMGESGIGLQKGPSGEGLAHARLGGYLAMHFGPVLTGFELNMQCPTRHLLLEEMRDWGRLFVLGSERFLRSNEARPIFESIARRRKSRDELIAKYGDRLRKFENPTHMEQGISFMRGVDRQSATLERFLECFAGKPTWETLLSRLDAQTFEAREDFVIGRNIDYWRARCLFELGRNDEALPILQKSVERRGFLIAGVNVPFTLPADADDMAARMKSHLDRYRQETWEAAAIVFAKVYGRQGDLSNQWKILQKLCDEGDDENEWINDPRKTPRQREKDKEFLTELRAKHPDLKPLFADTTGPGADMGIGATNIRMMNDLWKKCEGPVFDAFRPFRLTGLILQIEMIRAGKGPKDKLREKCNQLREYEHVLTNAEKRSYLTEGA